MPTIIQIPYLHNAKSCLLEIKYAINTDPITSGFEIVKNLVPDLSICIGYPTMHAYIKKHEGYGFCRYCGFIQIVTIKTENEDVRFVDVPAAMKGIPFSSYGYPAEKYDAPVNSYGLGNDLIWTAKSFLVDMPSFINNDKISFLAGFSWGYVERSSDNGRNIEIIPIETIEQDGWLEEASFLKENCPNWSFA